MISSIPISSIDCAIALDIPESVMMTSTRLRSQILPKPLRPNFEESANMIVRREASIIFLFRLASAIFELVIPCSKSIPSTPKKSLEQVICSKSCEVNRQLQNKNFF